MRAVEAGSTRLAATNVMEVVSDSWVPPIFVRTPGRQPPNGVRLANKRLLANSQALGSTA